MKMQTYVNFDGTCAEAFRYYERHLGGTVTMMMTHGELPDQSAVKPEWKDAVLHARMAIGATGLLGADIPGAQPMRSASPFAERRQRCRSRAHLRGARRGGTVLMKMDTTFFATRFAQVRDRFGVNWMILHERGRAVDRRPDATIFFRAIR